MDISIPPCLDIFGCRTDIRVVLFEVFGHVHNSSSLVNVDVITEVVGGDIYHS